MDRSHKKLTDDGYDFTSKKIKQEGELEVTGVSRSGRVRKKSSKLTDFESLDELDIRANSRIKKEKLEPTVTPVSRPIKKERVLVKEEILSDVEEGELARAEYTVKQEQYSDESENEGYPPNEDSSEDSLGSEMEEMNEVEREGGNGFQPLTGEDSSDEASSQQRGHFGSNKSNKKKLVIQDGKILGKGKTPKKDKGKGRITAYVLWAKEMRQKLMRTNPDMDFSQMSKKLGELWGRVPFHEKDMWKRRANRASALKKQQANPNQTRPAVLTHIATTQDQQSNHLRKPKTSPTRKFMGKQIQPQHHLQQALTSPPAISTTSSVSTDSKNQTKSGLTSESSVFKPVSTSAMDVAAHLKLLGESLTIIGERLTEHEGQIAVSGSFSVLLDSLLCALGPLLCLTQQVPQMNVVPQEQLSQIMDNIAYIMPGL